MATSTVVITYTAATGEKDAKVTSLTVGGTAYGSLTATDVATAAFLMGEAQKLLRAEKNTVSLSALPKGPTS